MIRLSVLLAGLAFIAPAAAQDTAGVKLEVDELILDNGMKVLTVERPGVPRVFCSLYWKVGSVNERPGITGLSHFFEHMMFKGTDVIGTTDPKKDRALNAKIEETMGKIRALKLAGLEALRKGEPVSETARKGGATVRAQDEENWKKLNAEYTALIEDQKLISVGEHLSKLFSANGGTGLNASTFYDWTRYFVDLPSNKVELFFWLESDRFLNPVFREFYPEREVVKEERRMRYDSTPTGLIMQAFMAQFWESHPYGWPVIGWMSDIDQYTYADAQRYFDIHYAPANCTAVFVGDCKKADIRKLAEKYFGRIPKGKTRPDPIVTLENEQVAEKRVVAEAEAQPQIQIWWHGPSQVHADAPALDVLSLILAGRAGRLHKALVLEQKVALQTNTTFWGLKYGGAFEVTALPRPEVPFEKLEAALLAVVEALRTEPVGDRELRRAKNQMLAGLVQQMDTNSGIAAQLGLAEINESWKDVFKIVPDAERVTADDLLRAAKQYLTPQGKNVLIIRRRGASAPKEGGRQP
jgi:predicted Zn-dependent peptidase